MRRNLSDRLTAAIRSLPLIGAFRDMDPEARLSVESIRMWDTEPSLGCPHAWESVGPYVVFVWDRSVGWCGACADRVGRSHAAAHPDTCDGCGETSDGFLTFMALHPPFVVLGSLCAACGDDPSRFGLP